MQLSLPSIPVEAQAAPSTATASAIIPFSAVAAGPETGGVGFDQLLQGANPAPAGSGAPIQGTGGVFDSMVSPALPLITGLTDSITGGGNEQAALNEAAASEPAQAPAMSDRWQAAQEQVCAQYVSIGLPPVKPEGEEDIPDAQPKAAGEADVATFPATAAPVTFGRWIRGVDLAQAPASEAKAAQPVSTADAPRVAEAPVSPEDEFPDTGETESARPALELRAKSGQGEEGNVPAALQPRSAQAPTSAELAAFHGYAREFAQPPKLHPAGKRAALETGAEKIADSSGSEMKAKLLPLEAGRQDSLSSFNQDHAPGASGVGIPAAELKPMTPTSLTPTRFVLPEESAGVGLAAAEAAEKSQPQQAAAPQSTAHRAVEVALSTAERFSAREQRSVSLQFNIGGNDLNVRVEMKAGEVHTTFRTDSADLRAALAQEWQSVATPSHSGERGARLAQPVFTSSDPSSLSGGGEGAPRQREQQEPTPGFAPFVIASRASNGAAEPAAAAGTSAPRAISSSVHLHTLA